MALVINCSDMKRELLSPSVYMLRPDPVMTILNHAWVSVMVITVSGRNIYTEFER